MGYIPRLLERRIHAALERNRSVLLLGARQTGKTTLLERVPADLSISLVRPDVRLRYERRPSLLADEVEALPARSSRRRTVLLDEIQKVPSLLDVVQDLVDRRVANFVLTGSSARKLRRGSSVNLLPGRLVTLRLDPLTTSEWEETNLERVLSYGSLPGIALQTKPEAREEDLQSYVTTYLEEEVRAEAVVRNLGAFARFLEYAATDSGRSVSFRRLSQDVGVAHTTIAAYYEVLEDCLIAERVDPLTRSGSRRKLIRSSKYLIFDLGVRRACAREGPRPPRDALGPLLEHWVGLELVRHIHLSTRLWSLRFWRDPDGPEVDWVLEGEGELVPIEVKWTDSPERNHIRHLQVFLEEYKDAGHGYLVCRAPRRMKLAENVTGIPWSKVADLVPR